MRFHHAFGLTAALLLSATAAFATPLTGSYSISEQYDSSHGGPTITNSLASHSAKI